MRCGAASRGSFIWKDGKSDSDRSRRDGLCPLNGGSPWLDCRPEFRVSTYFGAAIITQKRSRRSGLASFLGSVSTQSGRPCYDGNKLP
jgi:hypothetical protein